jgi:hypothetical protein
MRRAFPCLLIALALAVPAFAQDDPEEVDRPASEARVPNFLSTTGLLYTPSAYVPRSGDISIHFHGHEDFIGGGGTVGIGDRFELGLGAVDFDNDFGGDTSFLLNGKFNLLKETDNIPAITVGVMDALDEFDVDPSWYVVASKYFTRRDTEQRFALKGHLGFGGGIFDEEIFAGAELFFSRELSAMAEFINDDINLGVRYHRNGFAATVGLFDFDQLGGGLSYTFRFGGGGGESTTTTSKAGSSVKTAKAVK